MSAESSRSGRQGIGL